MAKNKEQNILKDKNLFLKIKKKKLEKKRKKFRRKILK